MAVGLFYYFGSCTCSFLGAGLGSQPMLHGAKFALCQPHGPYICHGPITCQHECVLVAGPARAPEFLQYWMLLLCCVVVMSSLSPVIHNSSIVQQPGMICTTKSRALEHDAAITLYPFLVNQELLSSVCSVHTCGALTTNISEVQQLLLSSMIRLVNCMK